MKRYLKICFYCIIVVVIFAGIYFLYLNDNSTKEGPKKAKYVKANYIQST